MIKHDEGPSSSRRSFKKLDRVRIKLNDRQQMRHSKLVLIVKEIDQDISLGGITTITAGAIQSAPHDKAHILNVPISINRNISSIPDLSN